MMQMLKMKTIHYLNNVIFRHERTEHGFEIAATSCQHSLVTHVTFTIQKKSYVAELSPIALQKCFHILLQRITYKIAIMQLYSIYF